MTKQQQFSQNLRNLADWYDQHPEAEAPEDVTISVFFQPGNYRLLPAGDDSFNGGNFTRTVLGDGYRLRFYTYASGVATQVTKEQVAEVKVWEIKPELLPVEELVAAGISDDDIPW